MLETIRRRAALPLCLILFGPLAACASVTRGTDDAWSISTDPTGAKVETSNGHQCQATPCAIKMSRKSEFTATVTKPGYKTATVSVTHKTSTSGAVGMAGNVLVGGIIGVGVDAVTGATQDLTPNPVNLVLEKEQPNPAAESAPVKAQAEAPKAEPAAVPAAADAAATTGEQPTAVAAAK